MYSMTQMRKYEALETRMLCCLWLCQKITPELKELLFESLG